MAMKDQEQPVSPKFLEPDLAPLGIGYGKGWGLLPDPASWRGIEVHFLSFLKESCFPMNNKA
jgi:hypothetical protein